MAGKGRLYSLRDAMALDDAKDAKGNSRLVAPYYETTRTEKRSLREMVAAFVETDADGDPVLSKPARTALAEKILLRWAGAEGNRGDFLRIFGFFGVKGDFCGTMAAMSMKAIRSISRWRGDALSVSTRPRRLSQGYLAASGAFSERLAGEGQ